MPVTVTHLQHWKHQTQHTRPVPENVTNTINNRDINHHDYDDDIDTDEYS